MTYRNLLTAAGIILSLLHFTSATAQVTPLPYYENFDTAATARWSRFETGTTDPGDFPWYITIHHPYSPSFSMMHTCNTGTSQADDWTVCRKAFDFTAGGQIDSIRSWITATNPPAAGDTIAIYLLSGSPDPALAADKTLLHDFRGAHFQQEEWIKTSNISIPAMPGNSYIAFRYKTAGNCINIFLDNMQLSGNAPSAINNPAQEDLVCTLFPNPVRNRLQLHSTQTFEKICIYAVTGQLVHTQEFQPEIDLSALTAGVYFVELVNSRQQKSIHRIVKQ